jgi:hypothetical protein
MKIFFGTALDNLDYPELVNQDKHFSIGEGKISRQV